MSTKKASSSAFALAPHIDPEAAEMELGYIVAPDARGRGVATEMLQRLTEWAFSERSAERLVLLIDCANAASLRVAERADYKREGVLRSLQIKPGVRADTEMWSRLPTD